MSRLYAISYKNTKFLKVYPCMLEVLEAVPQGYLESSINKYKQYIIYI